MSKVVVIGAGSWGTAIAAALARAGQNVAVLARRAAQVEALAADAVFTCPKRRDFANKGYA